MQTVVHVLRVARLCEAFRIEVEEVLSLIGCRWSLFPESLHGSHLSGFISAVNVLITPCQLAIV